MVDVLMMESQPKPKVKHRRDEILQFIVTYASDHQGNSPSLGEISLHFRICRQTAYGHTLKLSDERRAQWRDGKLCLVGAEFSPPTDTVP